MLPSLDETTIKFRKNTTSGLTALQYSVADRFSHNSAPFYSFTGSVGDQRPLDHFFQALTLGSEAIPPSQLLGPANTNTLLNRTTHLYRKYMAQLINSNMRTAPLYPNPTYNATITLPTARLKQNNGSKVTLQILLAVMFVCGSLAYIITDMRHTLPHNPHTIAGSISLLAGSEMTSRHVVPEGAEWMTDKQLKKAGVFDGYLFSLGWWQDWQQQPYEHGKRGGSSEKPTRGRFGIDIGRAEKEL